MSFFRLIGLAAAKTAHVGAESLEKPHLVIVDNDIIIKMRRRRSNSKNIEDNISEIVHCDNLNSKNHMLMILCCFSMI